MSPNPKNPSFAIEIELYRYAKKARHVVATRACVTILARMLPAWLRARPQNQPSTPATMAHFQLGNPPQPQVQQPEDGGGDEQRARAAQGPVLDPLLQHAAHEETLRRATTRQSMPTKVAAMYQTGLGAAKWVACEQQRQRQPDGHEVEEMQQADAPLAARWARIRSRSRGRGVAASAPSPRSRSGKDAG